MIKKKNLKKTISVVLVLLFVVSGFTVSINCEQESFHSGGNTLYVGGTGPGNYSTIQSAIENASDGDIVFVFNGTYTMSEDVGIYNEIVLMGEDVESVFIENEQTKKTLYIFADQVGIYNFSFHNICVRVAGDHISLNDNIFLIERFNYEGKDGVIDSNGGEHNVFKGNSITIENHPVDTRYKPSFGIRILDEDYCIITQNNVCNAIIGISVSGSSCSISENTISESDSGLEIYFDIDSFSANYDIHRITKNNFLNNDLIHASVYYHVNHAGISFASFIWNLFRDKGPSQNFSNNYWDDHQSREPREIYALYSYELVIFQVGTIVVSYPIQILKPEVDPNPASSPFLFYKTGGIC